MKLDPNDPRVSQRTIFKQPESFSAPIWRYIDYTKLMSMLVNSELFFCQALRLQDPFEGSLLSKHKDEIELCEALGYDESIAKQLAETAKRLARARYSCCVNCWCQIDTEHDAFWKIYGGQSYGVAIKSTYEKLALQLPEGAFIGCVEYIDYEDFAEEEYFRHPLMYKRKEFSYEREIRAIVVNKSTAWPEPNIEEYCNFPPSHVSKIDPNELVSEIVISPYAKDWLYELVDQSVNQVGFNRIRISESKMKSDPVHAVVQEKHEQLKISDWADR